MTPRDQSTSFDEAKAAVGQVLSTIPETNLIDLDETNKIAIIEIPADAEASVRKALEPRFLVDPNAPLRF